MQSRRRLISASVTVLTIALAMTSATGAVAASHRPPASAIRPRTAGSHSGDDLPSIGYIAAGANNFDVLNGLTSGSLVDAGTIPVPGQATASAISPDGDSAVFADYRAALSQAEDIRAPGGATAGPTLDFSAYNGEGGNDFQPFASSVALGDTFGLVALDSQGLLQLRLIDGTWQVDDRVQSPGVNEIGEPHPPGWIRFGKSGMAPVFDSALISDVPLPNGKYLGLSTDRGKQKGVLGVVEGVGTANPKLVGKLRSPDLEEINQDQDTGNGAVAFSPATATRAVLATNTGFDVIDLSKPAHPKIVSKTVAGKENLNSSIAIAPDGDHVAIAAAAKITIYDGLLSARGPLTTVGTVAPAAGDNSIAAMSYLADDRLLVEHSGFDQALNAVEWYASVITSATTKKPKILSSVQVTDEPKAPNAMAVYPALNRPAIHLSDTKTKVGKPAKIKLEVRHGIGSYTFAVKAGKLPAGLAIEGDKIVGTPKHTATKAMVLRARNQYDGTAFLAVSLRVT